MEREDGAALVDVDEVDELLSPWGGDPGKVGSGQRLGGMGRAFSSIDVYITQ